MGLRDFLEYLGNKRFVKLYESNPENYELRPDGRNVSCLKISSKYCSAVADVSLHVAMRGTRRLEKMLTK